MTFSSSRTILLALLLALPFTAQAQTHAKHPKHSQTQPQLLKVSTLKGKFVFTLPKGYSAEVLPEGDEASGSKGAKGTMYSNPTEKRVVIATQMPTPDGKSMSDYDGAFLDSAVTGYLAQQGAALPDFKKLGETEFTLNGLGVRQIDSSATQGGGQTLETTFLAGSGMSMAIVQVISRADDQAGHAALVKKIASGH